MWRKSGRFPERVDKKKPPEGGFSQGLRLAAQTQLFDELLITAVVAVTEVIQKAAAAADHILQATAGAVVFFMDFQMFRQLFDAGGQNGNLDLNGSSVCDVGGVIGIDLFFCSSVDVG